MITLHELDFVTDIMLFLSMAILVVPFAKLIRVGTIVGYLIAGVILGPWGFGQYLGSHSAHRMNCAPSVIWAWLCCCF